MSKISEKFPIHERIEKTDLSFEYFSIIILGLLCILLAIKAIQFSLNLNNTENTETIFVIAGAVLSLYALVFQVHKIIRAWKVVPIVNLTTKVNGNDVTITCSLNNAGKKTLYPLLTNLYISESIPKKDDDIITFEFEPITQHRIYYEKNKRCYDCIVSRHCKNEVKSFDHKEKNPPVTFPKCTSEKFQNTLRYCCNLKLLSYVSLLYLMPKETFKEDIVIRIDKPGYYRAFVIYTDIEWNDCTCSSSTFSII